MTALIEKQLVIMGVMVYCGLTAGLVNHTVFVFRKRFVKNKWCSGLIQILGLLLTGWCIGEFLYYSSYGKITGLGVGSFFVGLWIWKKLLCRDTKDGEKQWRKKEADSENSKRTIGYWILPIRSRNAKKRKAQEKK
jgi:hypothetical protein